MPIYIIVGKKLIQALRTCIERRTVRSVIAAALNENKTSVDF